MQQDPLNEVTGAAEDNRDSGHPVVSYYILACALSWLIQLPLALQAQGVIQARLPFAMHYLSGFGPLLSAVYVTWRLGGTQGLAKLFRRLGKWRVGLRWWLVAISPLIAIMVLSLGTRLIDRGSLTLAQLGQVDRLPTLGIGSLVLWIFTFGLGEETGWRGFALPHLQRGRSALAATLILWALWSLWHLPLFFYMYPFSVLPGLVIGLLAGAVVFTWIYNSTGGSVLMTIIWHGTFNYVTACSACKTGATAALVSALVMVWAVAIVIFFKPANLTRAYRLTAEHENRIDASEDLHTDPEQAPPKPKSTQTVARQADRPVPISANHR